MYLHLNRLAGLTTCVLVLSWMALPVSSLAQCTIRWANAASGAWTDAANWDSMSVPGAEDHVCIDLPGTYTVTLNSDATIHHLTLGTGGSDDEQTVQISGTGSPGLTMTGDLDVAATGRLRFSYQLSVAGSVNVQGTLQMNSTSSVLRGSGDATIADGGTLLLRGTIDGRDITNLGTIRVTENVMLENDVLIDNQATLIHEAGGGGRGFSGSGSLRNSGTFRKINSGSVPIQVPLTNTGTFIVEHNYVDLEGPTTHTGASITVADGRLLRLRGGSTHTFEDVSLGGEGEIEIYSSGTVLEVVDALEIPAGLRLSMSSSGTFTGTGDVTINGVFEMGYQTVLGGTGAFTVADGGTALLEGTLDGRDITNLGTTDITDYLTLSNDALIDNQNMLILSGATRTLSGEGRVVNSDTTRKVGIHFFEVQVPFVNDGVVDVQEGPLTIQNVFDNNPGGIVQGVGRLNLLDATFNNAGTVAPGSSPGRLRVSGTYPNGTGTLAIEIGGLTAEEAYDVLQAFTADLSGTLAVSFIDGFVPTPDDAFTVVQGTIEGGFERITGAVDAANDLVLYPSIDANGQHVTLTAASGVPTLGSELALSTASLEGGAVSPFTLTGTGFAPDATFRLVCNTCNDPDAHAEVPLLIRSMSATEVEVAVDLRDGEIYGTYDVVVDDPRGGSATAGPLAIAPGSLELTVEVTDAAAGEGGRELGVFTIRANYRTPIPVPITFTLGGTATPFADFVTSAPKNTVTLPQEADHVQVRVFPLADDVADDGETVTLTLQADDDYTLGEPTSGEITIADGPPTSAFDVFIVTPTQAGNEGTAVVTVVGQAFTEGATVRLQNGGTTIEAGQVTVGADQNQIAAVFDLTGQATGAWDVVVTNGDGSTETLAGAFTVEAAVVPDLWVEVNGPPAIRPGRLARYSVSVTNRGNVDAVLVPLFISLAKSDRLEATLEPLFAIPDLPEPPGYTDFTSWDEVETVVDTLGQLIYPLVIPLIPPGETITLEMRALTPQMRAWVTEPMLTGFPLEDGSAKLAPRYAGLIAQELGALDVLGCVVTVLSSAADIALDFIPGVDCVKSVRVLAGKMFFDAGSATTISNQEQGLAWMQQWLVGIGGLLIDCGSEAFPITKAAKALAKTIKRLMTIGASAAAIYASCKPIIDEFSGTEHESEVVSSIDPNDKLGPTGAGEARHVTGFDPFTYQIRFENKAEATAPAAEVVVVDTLDTATLDLSTFSLGTFYFGDRSHTPPRGLSRYTTTMDLRPEEDLLVQIDAVLDEATGIATWRFTSLDPATGQPPEDPFAGFLPPNHNPPEGDGGVYFTIVPRPLLASGTTVQNMARIFFDFNEPIDTPVWTNTLDKSAPSSTVGGLAEEQHQASFPVSWSGSDAGAGILYYTVYVSENDGPFEAWRVRTKETSADYSGEVGSTYAFYTVARDAAGNLEAAPDEPDAVTTVTTAVASEKDPALPKAFSLAQNYPNPFNPVTTIRYALPRAVRVELEMYDVLGQRVAVLVDGDQPAGYYDVQWQGTQWPSGVYFYRLRAGTFVETRRMVLVK